MRVVQIVLPLALLGLSPPLEGAEAVEQPSAAPTGRIVAVLAPPSTNYTAELTDPEGGTLTYEWSAGLSCGTFVPATPEPKKARWDHGAEHGCAHDTQNHPGTITVVVSDPEGNEVICVYDGSLSGEEPCQSAVPLLSIDDVEVGEADMAAVFTLTLSRSTDKDVTATVFTHAVSACESFAPAATLADERNDYGPVLDPVVIIPAGETSASFAPPVFDDLLDERAETFSAVISTATNATIADGEGQATITDDDREAGLLVLGDHFVDEDRGPAEPSIRFNGDVPSGKVVRVTVATEDGSATAGSDYRAREDTLTIAPPGCGEKGRRKFTFPVRVIDDTRDESRQERFFVVLRDPVRAILDDAMASVLILDND